MIDLGLIWGVVLIALSAVCWGGQLISSLAPETAGRWGLTEAETDVEPVFFADGRGEALWDAVTLWPMLVAGVLLTVDQSAWPYFGLVGGGSYVYFAGRGVITRIIMRRRGFKIGSVQSVKVGLIALVLWGVMAAVTIVAAVIALEG